MRSQYTAGVVGVGLDGQGPIMFWPPFPINDVIGWHGG